MARDYTPDAGEELAALREYHEATDDDAYERHRQRVDEGQECPTCRTGAFGIDKTVQLGIPLFRCRNCGAEWFDFVTTPTRDTRTLPLFPSGCCAVGPA